MRYSRVSSFPFSPYLEILRMLPGNSLLPVPDWLVFRFPAHTSSPVHRRHKHCPVYGNTEIGGVLPCHPAARLFPAGRAWLMSIVHICGSYLTPFETILLLSRSLLLCQVHTGASFRCGIPDRHDDLALLRSVLHSRMPERISDTTLPLPFRPALHECPVYTFCHIIHGKGIAVLCLFQHNLIGGFLVRLCFLGSVEIASCLFVGVRPVGVIIPDCV